jgi:serine/threonine protein kinase
VDKNGYLKLCDFGISQIRNETNSHSSNFITTSFHFDSPEVVLQEQSVSYQHDYYALGYTLHCILFKREPFQDHSEDMALRRFRKSENIFIPFD